MRRGVAIAGKGLGTILVLALSSWMGLALWYRLPVPETARLVAAGSLALAGLATAIALWTTGRRKALLGFATLAALVIFWWGTITPPATVDFAPDVARQARVVAAGDHMTIRDLRDFRWRSETDVTEVWEERTYDLGALSSVDLLLSHWDNSGIAHMIMSFGFKGGEYLAWSVEVRRRTGGGFSPLADLFKSNTLVLVAATERDVIGVRSNIRGEDVHRYRLNLLPATIRTMLLEYAAEANRLAEKPAFYNSLTTNCTTSIVTMMRAMGATVPLDWRLILNARLPDYAFDHDALEAGIPLAELKRRAPIGAKARAAGLSDGFSAAIRAN